jgi:hypothetical protein
MEHASRGGFSQFGSEGDERVFDPGHEFIPKYSARREAFQSHVESSAKGIRDVLVSPGSVPQR